MIVHDDWGYDQLGKKDILTIRLVDGSEHRAVCTTARGDAEDPLTREETIAKFRGCAENILAPTVCDAAIAILVDLPKASSVVPLLEMITPTPVPQTAAACDAPRLHRRRNGVSRRITPVPPSAAPRRSAPQHA